MLDVPPLQLEKKEKKKKQLFMIHIHACDPSHALMCI